MRYAFLRLLFALVLCLGCTAAATAAPYVYTSLPFSDAVSVINPVNDTLIGTVHLVKGTSVCSTPAGLAPTPNGAKVYVACLNSPFVFVIDTATNTVADPVSLPSGSRSQEIAIAPNGLKAYVVIQDSNAVGVIDTSTNTLTTTISGGFDSPHGIAIMPNGAKAYVTNHGINASGTAVSVINLGTNAVTTVGVGGRAPIGVVVKADNTKAYVGHKGGISVIDTTNDTEIAIVLSPTGHLAISPNGAEVWASEASQGLAVIHTSDNSRVLFSHRVDVMGLTSDGTKLYSTTENDSVL